jgi:ribosomal protein S20
MPIIKSAIKRAKQTTKRRERNVAIKQEIKNATKAFIAKPSTKTLSAAQSEIDTAVKKGLIKKNTASRRKSRLHAIAKNAGVKLATATKKPAPKATTAKTTTKKPTAKKTATKSTSTKKTPTKKPVAKKTTK